MVHHEITNFNIIRQSRGYYLSITGSCAMDEKGRIKAESMFPFWLNKVTIFDSKSSAFSASTISNSTSEHTSSNNSNHSALDDAFGLSFVNGQQLMDDLAIIDDLYAIYGQEESDCFDGESVALVARKVANKHKVLQELCQSEANYISDLNYFQQHYIHFIIQWLQAPGNKTNNHMNNKMDKAAVTSLYMYQDLLHSHRLLIRSLSERLKIWGAGQIISDSFFSLESMVNVYHAFLASYANIMVSISKLCSQPSFVKSLESHIGTVDNRAIHDLLHYLRLPLSRLHAYTQALSLLIEYSDPLHVDYEALNSVLRSYKRLLSVVQERMVDSQNHFLVLEATRTITGCPIQVTFNRRLLLKSRLIKVDLDDLSSTTDVRTYILYNDQLIYCKKDANNNSSSTGSGSIRKQQSTAATALQYKGTIDLIHCELRILSPAVCAKMAQIRRPFLSFRSTKKSAGNDGLGNSPPLTPPPPPSTAYGFELVTKENNMDIMPANYENATSASGAPLKHRHIIRTQSLEEQTLWVDTLEKVIQYIKWVNSNNHP